MLQMHGFDLQLVLQPPLDSIVPAQLPVWVTPKITAELNPCPCWEQLCSASLFATWGSTPWSPTLPSCTLLWFTQMGQDASKDHGHRMLCVGKDIQRHLVQHPCNEQGHLQLRQVAQPHPNLEFFQGWSIHHLSQPTCSCTSPLSL